MILQTEKEIIICDKCKGVGHKNEVVRVGAYDSELYTYKCKECNGSGRLIKTITIESFENLINE